MKKLIAVISLLCCLMFTNTAFADLGPKPSLTINAENMPNSNCYLDLLIDYSPENIYRNISDKSKYDQRMFSILEQYNVGGWRPAIVTGTMPPMYGDIVCNVENGKCSLHFGYAGVPDKFKVIVVSSDGKVVVSNEIKRMAFKSTIKFDYSTGKAAETSPILSYFIQFISTCLATLFIEGIILILFQFSFKANWKVFIVINIITQVMLTMIITYLMFRYGTIVAFVTYIPFEVAILVLEAILFAKYLKEYTKQRRVLYSIAANTMSFFIGIILLRIP